MVESRGFLCYGVACLEHHAVGLVLAGQLAIPCKCRRAKIPAVGFVWIFCEKLLSDLWETRNEEYVQCLRIFQLE